MKAREIMTRDVVSVRPGTPVQVIAKLLVDRSISAVPVVDDEGAPIGMVSEGDLIGRDEPSREARRDWWLDILAEGDPLNADFLASHNERLARDIMAEPVVTIGEDTDAGEIARLLQTYRIKRVPVIRNGRVVGVVSRADLLRAMAQEPAPIPTHKVGLLASAIAGLDERFGFRHSPEPPQPAAALSVSREPGFLEAADFQAADFRELVQDFEHRQDRTREEAHRAAAEQRQQRVGQLINEHISDQSWQDILHRARHAAENGEKEFMLLRFPSHLCSDRGRAIDVTEPDWPATLRGEAAEIYLRWERDLKPRGFHITAQVVDYPGGVPGDIGLFLIWG
jgi:CBS domain-containing protein